MSVLNIEITEEIASLVTNINNGKKKFYELSSQCEQIFITPPNIEIDNCFVLSAMKKKISLCEKENCPIIKILKETLTNDK